MKKKNAFNNASVFIVGGKNATAITLQSIENK